MTATYSVRKFSVNPPAYPDSWVIFSITFFGGIFGVIGMFIGVPLFAVIYAAIKSMTEKKLAGKNLSINTEDYISVGSIEDNAYIDYVKLSKKERKHAAETERARKRSQSPVARKKGMAKPMSEQTLTDNNTSSDESE